MGDDVVIRTESLTKVYTSLFGKVKVKALDNLTLQVRRGEVFGLIGPNGSGKTTAIKLLLGLLFPTSGRAEILGHPPSDVQTKSRIGFLPEESYLYGFLNADETLDFFGRLFHIPAAERRRRIDELVERFEIAHARKRPVREYSKGMMRRVMFCQTLINDPEVVILDEPTSGLDPISSRKIKDLIVELKKQGKSVLLSSHLLADMQDVCDRVAILYQGVLRKVDTVRNLLVNKDLVTLVLGDVSPDALDRIRELLSREGARVVSCDQTQENLENVFLKTIRESQAPKEADGGDPGVQR
jgi:ABC-2 type transport system ATP-binding protein